MLLDDFRQFSKILIFVVLPVVARAAAALPETVADAGLLLADPTPSEVAAALARVLDDGDLRVAMSRQGHTRADHFSPARSAERMRVQLDGILARLS